MQNILETVFTYGNTQLIGIGVTASATRSSVPAPVPAATPVLVPAPAPYATLVRSSSPVFSISLPP